MFKQTGGNTVGTGYYWNWRAWRLEVVEGRAGLLPGGDEDAYLRVPTLAMFVIAPIMGALFVIFLPFIGFVLLGEYAWKSLRSSVRKPEDTPETKAL